MPALPGDRQQPRLDEVLLARLEHDRALLVHELADPVEAGGGEGHRAPPDRVAAGGRRTPARCRVIASGMRSSGQDLVGEAGLGDRRRACPRRRTSPGPGRRRCRRPARISAAPLRRRTPCRSGRRPGRRRRRRRRPSGTARRRRAGRSSPAAPGSARSAGRPSGRPSTDDEVVVAGGDVHGAGRERAAVGGLDHPQRAEPVEPLGELAGEDRRHVLHDAGPAPAAWPAAAGSTRASASGPPVEEPMTRTAGFLAGAGARRGRRGRGHGGSGARAGPAVTGRPVSALIFGISCSRTLSIDWPTLPTLAGLVT